MNTAAKLLSSSDCLSQPFHALQIIFIRMLCTTILGTAYMSYHSTPDFPFGPRGIRQLLILRGFAGFVGLFGLYCKFP
ncbi:hypothetical protein BDW02DRAFT_565115 [Decorospora gaudefroyi]|uniref:Uncharacterized protein n=1 Tax=Decorospora gaudefroyi TaxID=184978 RepID=A0A6A5KIU9_9PLEO|nr:hypothetical protein BDW02DRAFT_565115 [Decorospora gaudefroyi]